MPKHAQENNIKTVNGISLIGTGDVTISSEGEITIDTIPTDGSSNAVSSNGVFDALASKAQYYLTLADLKAVRPPNGTVGITGGFSAINDGGHGLYVFDSASTAADDGGITLLPTTGSGAGRWKQFPMNGEINAKTFGVKLDYTTDDTTALQASINACMLYEYDLYIPRGIAKITAELTIGTASSDSQYNQSSFRIRGAGISSDPNASVFPGAEGTQIRIAGTGHRSVIAFQESVWRYGRIEDLTVAAHTLGGATYGILFTDTRHSQFKLTRIHSERVDRCFGELKGNGLNGEFIRFEDCGGTGEENFFFMDSGSGQAFGHYFEHCTGGVKDGGALFEIGGGGLGFGMTLEDFHSTSIGSSGEVDPTYDTLIGVSFLRNHGISGYFHVSGGRNEHVNTLIENISTSYNEAGRISFDSVEFDGMTCTSARPAIKNTGGFAGAYGVKFTECSFNRFGFGNESLGVFSTTFHAIDACDILFERCHFNFEYLNIRNSRYTRVDFRNCTRTTPGRPQPFSNHGEIQRVLSERNLYSNVFAPQGRPHNLLKQSGFTVGSASAPSPWVNVGGNFSTTVKAFPDSGVASWSSSPNARLVTLASGTSVYQDVTDVNFNSGVHQDISGHTTGYFHAIVDIDATYSGNIVEFTLENSVTGRIYDRQTVTAADYAPHIQSINLVAVDADAGSTQYLRVRIALVSGSATPIRIYKMMVTNDPSAVYAPTTSSNISFNHQWDINTDLVRVDGRLQLPSKVDAMGSGATLPDIRAGEMYWSSDSADLKVYNGSTWNTVTTGSLVQSQYVIEKVGSTINAKAKPGSGLSNYTGTDAYTVIQAAINALTPAGSRGSGGGTIYITKGTYTLTDELTIVGWEGVAASSFDPYSQLVIRGEGRSTVLYTNTSGKNVLSVRNDASIGLFDIKLEAGSTARGALRLDSNGAQGEISVFGGNFDNLYLKCNNSTYPALYAANFFDLNVGSLYIVNLGGTGIEFANVSTTTLYGNSNFGFIRVQANTSSPHAGIKFTSTDGASFRCINLINFSSIQCVAAYYPIQIVDGQNLTFDFVDLEYNAYGIYIAGGTIERHNRFLSGIVNASTTAIHCGANAGDNYFRLEITGTGSTVPISDSQSFMPPNEYDVTYGSSIVPTNVVWGGSALLRTKYTYKSPSLARTYTVLPENTNIRYAISTKTTGYTLTIDDTTILADTSLSGFTLTLPAASSFPGKIFYIKKITSDSNVLTIDANGSETIDGDLTKEITFQWVPIVIQSNGSNWFIIN